MTVTVSLVNTATNQTVVTDKYSAAGTKQYQLDSGAYNLQVKIEQANGNSKFSVDLKMPVSPDDVKLSYLQEEVPLGEYGNFTRDPDMPKLQPPSWFLEPEELALGAPTFANTPVPETTEPLGKANPVTKDSNIPLFYAFMSFLALAATLEVTVLTMTRNSKKKRQEEIENEPVER